MERIQFQVDIQTSAQKVYENMLGLNDIKTYEYWTAAFNPTSTYEGKWEKGSKILFVGLDEKGKRGGMVSEVVENKPSEFVSVRHYGFVDGDKEVTTGEQVEKWAGGFENYSFSEKDEITTVLVEMDTIEDYKGYLEEAYPKGLDLLKELSER
ncbi:MAG: SRPBCC domain-containing protein [Flavobacteriia bacterium]